MSENLKPRIGVSGCLLGQEVRYNGGHCREDWILDELSQFAELVPFCPEVAMGMGVPRESVRLIKKGEIRMVAQKSGRDWTEKAKETSSKLVRTLAEDSGFPKLNGFIFKKNSPSCGLRVKTYSEKGPPNGSAPGVFAHSFVERFPGVPVTEEGRLTDLNQKEHFLEQVFAHARLMKVGGLPSTRRKISELHSLHARYKFILLAHSPKYYSELGRIASNSDHQSPNQVFDAYATKFLEALAVRRTRAKTINALQHLFGFIKDRVGSEEKEQFAEWLDEYRQGVIPLSVPSNILALYARKFSLDYLKAQVFFEPFPKRMIRELPDVLD